MKTAWEKYTGEKIKEVLDFSEGYKTFLSESKTERESVNYAVAAAEKAGYKNFKNVTKLEAGDKVYFNGRGKILALFEIGKKPLECGMNILGAHIDSPRIDIKLNPFYEDHGLLLMDTHYYGGIKNYQWVAAPLALHGVVCKKDGTTVVINMGENDNEPVLEISDLLPHLGKDQMSKPASNVIEGEDLNVLCGSIPGEDKDSENPVKDNILAILKSEYGIEEDDFLSAELELVPAGKARDLGFDKSMVMGYGHDDRICAYTSLEAILDSSNLERTAACILTDKEEVGSIGATGAQSAFFVNCVAEIMDMVGECGDLKLRRALENSYMLSSDVSAAYDSNFPGVFEAKNTAFFGKGISFNKYLGGRGKSGSNDATAEFIAKIRRVMDENDVSFQFSEIGKVDQGGGGTIAKFFGNLNMNVIDAGIAVQNMHSQYETASKVDIYEAYRAYKTFLKDID